MPVSLSPNLPPDKQREMLRQMLTIRRFEERASADYLAGKIYGVVRRSPSASVPTSTTATGSSRRIAATATASPRVPTSTA
jgi:TPP-dependent pyruvate/acetoin dehydrogenase alpha subunit